MNWMSVIAKTYMTITKTNIEDLFDELWPGMLYAHGHKLNCLTQLNSIQNYFKKNLYHNILLKNLCSLEGIGITIGTGLIWSVYPDIRVPFDKYTLTFALQKKIISSDKVSERYVLYSERIKRFCDESTIDERPYTIKDFVREAWVELEDSEFLAEPK